eukprot:SAG25_NODE_2982_length_1281_cov_19.755499_1_plen_189_part_00
MTKRFIDALKLQSRNYYTYQARTAVLTTFAESILWYLFEIHLLPEDSQRSKYLEAAPYAYLWKGGLLDCLGDVHNTEIAKVNQSYASKLKRNKVAKPWRQGSMYYTSIIIKGRARLFGHFLKLFEPKEANHNGQTGAYFYCFAHEWLMNSIGAAIGTRQNIGNYSQFVWYSRNFLRTANLYVESELAL